MTKFVEARVAKVSPKRRDLPSAETVNAIRQGVKAVQEGRSSPWPEVRARLGIK